MIVYNFKYKIKKTLLKITVQVNVETYIFFNINYKKSRRAHCIHLFCIFCSLMLYNNCIQITSFISNHSAFYFFSLFTLCDNKITVLIIIKHALVWAIYTHSHPRLHLDLHILFWPVLLTVLFLASIPAQT